MNSLYHQRMTDQKKVPQCPTLHLKKRVPVKRLYLPVAGEFCQVSGTGKGQLKKRC